MFVKNFPGRRDMRRRSALLRLKKDSDAYRQTEAKLITNAEQIQTKKRREPRKGK